MLQAYLGIVSPHGLEVFCPEHPQTSRFLRRRVRRTYGRTLGCWAVIEAEAAACVELTLRSGLTQVALEYLLQTAHDFGFLPAEDCLESESMHPSA
jgi:hypothetical protein